MRCERKGLYSMFQKHSFAKHVGRQQRIRCRREHDLSYIEFLEQTASKALSLLLVKDGRNSDLEQQLLRL